MFTSCDEEEETSHINEICDEKLEKSDHINENCDDKLEESGNTNEDEEPKVGMIFSSEEEVTEYYKNYALCMGFGVSKISSKNGDEGKRYFTLGCSRARSYVSNSKKLLKPNHTTKVQCKARVNVCVSLDGTITISKVSLEHNHELSPGKSRYFRCNKNLNPHIKRRLELNDRDGINVSKKIRSLVVEANGYDNLTFGEKDCRNYIDKLRRLRLGTGDAEAIRKYFVGMQKKIVIFFM
jgi:hypothetical protein